MSNLPVICIITSNECGHCKTTRGSGEIKDGNSGPKTIPGNYSWSQDYFKRLIFGDNKDEPKNGEPSKNYSTPKYRVIELFFAVLNSNQLSHILNYIEFKWEDNKVVRYVYSLENSPSPMKTVESFKNKTTTIDINYDDFILGKVPKQIFNYVRFYPTWVFFPAESWDGAIKSNSNNDNKYTPLIGYAVGLKIKRNDKNGKEQYTIEKGGKDVIPKADNSVDLAAYFLINGIKLPSKEIIDKSVPPGLEKEKIVTKGENSQELESQINTLNFRIISPNDEDF